MLVLLIKYLKRSEQLLQFIYAKRIKVALSIEEQAVKSLFIAWVGLCFHKFHRKRLEVLYKIVDTLNLIDE